MPQRTGSLERSWLGLSSGRNGLVAATPELAEARGCRRIVGGVSDDESNIGEIQSYGPLPEATAMVDIEDIISHGDFNGVNGDKMSKKLCQPSLCKQ
jgi:hypothetical protein